MYVPLAKLNKDKVLPDAAMHCSQGPGFLTAIHQC